MTPKRDEATPIEILLVEDNPADRVLTGEALEEARIVNHLHQVDDGVEALAFLRRQGAHAGAPTPDLILLDLNMPRMDGREFLEVVKADEHLRHIPVVVLTTSKSEEDVLRSYHLRANCYITKPVDFDQFLAVVKTIGEFWLTVVTLPTQPPQGVSDPAAERYPRG
jgi:CheY-like chemotaxis protein